MNTHSLMIFNSYHFKLFKLLNTRNENFNTEKYLSILSDSIPRAVVSKVSYLPLRFVPFLILYLEKSRSELSFKVYFAFCNQQKKI